MFGLGWVELLIIGAVVTFLAGPAALRHVVASGRALQKTKDDLTGPRALDRLLLEDDEEPGEEERGPEPRSSDEEAG